MVLESILNPIKAEDSPWNLFFYGMVFTSIAIPMSYWIFETHASLVMVFLTVFAALPLMYKTLKYEEKQDLVSNDEISLLRQHSKALASFMFFFIGMTLSFSVWYILLPESITQSIFNVQTHTILNINNNISGHSLQQVKLFGRIFFNNVKVLTFCLLFSFLYGSGAIFILTWNASVIGTAIGNFVRSNLASIANVVGWPKVGMYLHIISLGLLKYTLHGIPEILAYFIGGMAGGIISVAVIRHDFGTTRFEKIVLDSSDLIVISVALLLIAALIEVYVTPVIF
ncbi:hypothetical protein GF351_01035 [Candidatus Woesearchaeota archaeon]|nr:hypothetical protein [Candidatus Woesearchaeota archaeon]